MEITNFWPNSRMQMIAGRQPEAVRFRERQMRYRTMMGGAVATLVLSGAATAAGPRTGLPGVFGTQGQLPVERVQSSTQALEEQVRQLNGRVEELNFQILQLQEQIRKMQEDNEFRFQELEGGKKSDAGGASERRRASGESETRSSQASTAEGVAPSEPATRPLAEAQPAANAGQAETAVGAAPGHGEPPRTFGTIVFDQSGNVVGGSVGDQTTVSRDPNAVLPPPDETADNTIVAALPSTNDPEELYRTSYDAVLSGKYRVAETGFRQHAERFPDDSRAADTQFWLGESLLSQRKYREAAEVFLAAGKKYPKAKKAPEMLFKLGVSLAGINQREVACATFAAVGDRYPKASETLKKRVAQEQAQVRC